MTQRDQMRSRTPLRCPICHGRLQDTLIRTMGSITPSTVWQMHAGKCPEHGWFQAETVGRPPREIFAVTRPFGVSRRLVIGDNEYYQFPTKYNDLEFGSRRNKYDPVDQMDPTLWEAYPVD